MQNNDNSNINMNAIYITMWKEKKNDLLFFVWKISRNQVLKIYYTRWCWEQNYQNVQWFSKGTVTEICCWRLLCFVYSTCDS